jgi:hypothetical protein
MFGDLLVIDIFYHSSCYTKAWEKFVQLPQRSKSSTIIREIYEDKESVKLEAAEVEYICIVQPN